MSSSSSSSATPAYRNAPPKGLAQAVSELVNTFDKFQVVSVGPEQPDIPLTDPLLVTAAPLISAIKQGLFQKSAASRGRKGKKNKSELHINIGNDTTVRWLKRPDNRAVHVSVVQGLTSQTLFTTNSTLPVFSAKYFTISVLPEVTYYSSVFDEYCVREIEVLIEPQVTEVTTSGTDVGELLTVIDVDDGSTPTTTDALTSFGTCVQSKGTQSHYHRWQPSAAISAYTGAFTGYANVVGLWCDAASPGIHHYGLKAGATAAPYAQTYTFQYRIHVMWRCMH